MKKSIHFRNLKSEKAVVGQVDRRLSFAFARTSHAINAVEVTLSDVNGPRGGIDKQCQVAVKPVGMPSIVVYERQSNLRVAIDRGISRAALALARQLKRRQAVVQRKLALKRLPSDAVARGYYATPPLSA